MKETRFCPFRRAYTTIQEERKMTQHADKYSVCLGERCMAYDAGDCLKLKAAKKSEENLKETALLWLEDCGKVKCPRCREIFDEYSDYCPNCGQRLEVDW